MNRDKAFALVEFEAQEELTRWLVEEARCTRLVASAVPGTVNTRKRKLNLARTMVAGARTTLAGIRALRDNQTDFSDADVAEFDAATH